MQRSLFEAEHEAFRESVAAFLDREVVPHYSAWSDAGIVPRALFSKAGELGVFAAVPEEYGGAGVDDLRFSAVLLEESAKRGLIPATTGLTLQSDVCMPYFLGLADDEQKRRWLPGIASGELITAVAMTEPGTGSHLSGIMTKAVLDGDHYVIDGAKTLISNGINADLVIVAARTSDHPHKGLSLIVVERGTPGFERGRNMEKVGMHAQDTAELSFTGAPVPVANRLGAEGAGFVGLTSNLAKERLSGSIGAVAVARAALDWTMDYVRERKAFGSSIGSFQNTRFRMAEMATEIDIAQEWVDRCLRELNAGRLSAVDAAKAKWWTTELQVRVVDTCLQLHGGYGYMLEYPIARAFVDSRIARIYGGTTEIMKEIVGRSLDLG